LSLLVKVFYRALLCGLLCENALVYATNALTGGTFQFSDPDWTNYPARFYRIRSQ
jgi:hypothetical protein